MAEGEKAGASLTGVRDITLPSLRRYFLFVCALLAMCGCGGPKRAGVEDLRGRENLTQYKLESLRGVRDGDRLHAQATFTNAATPLVIDMQFAVGPRTILRAGEWHWNRNGAAESGRVRARSVTFLGGQSGAPSIGGRFDLLTDSGAARYRVTIPVSQLARDGFQPNSRFQ